MRHTRVQAILIHKKKVLFLKQYNSKNKQEYWMYPGGNLEPSENLHTAIKRELLEECHIKLNNLRLIDDRVGNGQDTYKRYVTFAQLVNDISQFQKGEESVQYRKIIGFEWVDLNEIHSYNKLVGNNQIQPSINLLQGILKKENLI